MRVLKFIGVFLVTALCIFVLVIGWNWEAYQTLFSNRQGMADGSEWIEKTYSLEGLTEFIGENPEYVSISSVVIGEPDSVIHYQPDVQRTMGTTSNFFILAAYAELFQNGELNKESTIAWAGISEFQLPGIDNSIHRASYQAAVQRNWIQEDTLTYSRALELLAEFNDMALSDFLWWQLGPEFWGEFMNQIDAQTTQSPLPFSGLYLAISPEISQNNIKDTLKKWNTRGYSAWKDHVISLSDQFMNQPGLRAEYRSYLEENRLGITFMEERDALALFPSTTTAEMSQFLTQLHTNNFINEEVSRQVKEWMRWPEKRNAEIKRDFTDYGAIYDNRMGLLNGIDFGTSSYTGKTTVQAIFFDRLPVAFWLHMSSNHMHQDFQQRLIFDPALIEKIQIETQ